MTDPLEENLPDELRRLPRFLVWKANGPKGKIPYYISGHRRNGSLDSARDLGQLVTFDEARDALLIGDYAGLGFALVPADKLGAFDFDYILDDAGELIAGHAGYELALEARSRGAYMEVSPSGKGLRVVGPCEIQEPYSKNQVEFWGRARFITLTGRAWANPKAWVDITALRSTLRAPRTRGDDEFGVDPGIITPRLIEDLRWALDSFPSDDRDLWVRIGHALKTIGEKGKALWLEWSEKSPKFHMADALAKWDSFHPRQTGYKAVFAEAQRNGWKNPRANGRDGEADDSITPADLWCGYPPPELPAGLLPPVIEHFARKHGEVMGVDPAGLAMAALAVASAATSDAIVVRVKKSDPTWRESARLWVGLVGAPSRKKTPIIFAAARPLREIEAELAAAYEAECAAFEKLEPTERDGVARPRPKRRIIQDSTMEAAQEVLKDNPQGLLSIQDELAGWFGFMDKYSPGKGALADRGFWLQSYNGGAYNADRISRGAIHIKNCSVCLLGGIQPEPMRKIAKDLGDDGLVQRLVPVLLRPGQVGRDVPSNMVVADYRDLIRELVRKEGLVLRFDDGASAIREALEVKNLEAVQALEPVTPKLATHFGKYDGLFARLCVLWHVVEHADDKVIPSVIDKNLAQRVDAFINQFIRPSARAFYFELGISGDFDEVQALASLILAERLSEVDARTVQRSGGFQTYTADAVRLLCEKLESFGWLMPLETKGAGRAARWRVNPRVHSDFEEYGARERERRALAREALKSAFPL